MLNRYPNKMLSKPCELCGGKGVIEENRGERFCHRPMLWVKPCPRCKGVVSASIEHKDVNDESAESGN